jgi:arylsulfatase A-like enzyme
LIAPEDSFLSLYLGKFPEIPWGENNRSGSVYDGNDYGSDNFEIQGYASVSNPRAVFAALVTRMDHQVGEIINLLEELGIAENTLIVFTSDNGPHREGGADPDFFKSSAGLKGYKRDLFEGGIRVPMIIKWPGKIKPGSRTAHISAFWDVLPTFAEIANISAPEIIDGISFLPTLLGKNDQSIHDYLYWEFHELGGRQAVLRNEWKLISYDVLDPAIKKTSLYNISEDPEESIDLSEKYPDIIAELESLMQKTRVPSSLFPFVETARE